MRRLLLIALSVALVASVGCTQNDDGDPQTQATATTSATPQPTPCVLDDASTKTRESETASDVAPVTEVRWDDDNGCPRVVFEFQDQLANYIVGYTTELRECGSGEEPPADKWGGKAFLSVRLEPSGGPDPTSESGEPVYKGPRDIAVDGPVLKHLKVICDFEGVFEWIIALDAKHPFAVTTFEEPARLAIDISQS